VDSNRSRPNRVEIDVDRAIDRELDEPCHCHHLTAFPSAVSPTQLKNDRDEQLWPAMFAN
jgi:hypothetical protein